VLPNVGPGYADPPDQGRGGDAIAHGVASGDLAALYLFQTDPVRDRPDRALWERALHHAGLVVAHASVLTEGILEHASVVFPAESHAEKEGTVVHPDGRIQRLRMAIAHPEEVRASWSVLADVARRVGHDLGVGTSAMAFAQLVEAVPFYAGLTLDEIGGRGVRWPAREQAELPASNGASAAAEPGPPRGQAQTPANGRLRLGRYRSIWASPEVEVSPALKFLAAEQHVELSPQDAARLGIAHGESVEVAANGTSLRGTAAVRSGVPAGAAFLADGLARDSANELTDETVQVRKS
jgi:NADH-quinone oxidoreductase subunit G